MGNGFSEELLPSTETELLQETRFLKTSPSPPRGGGGRGEGGAPHTATIYLLPATVISGIFLFWPLAQVGWLALQRWNGYGPQRFVGLGNFVGLWGDEVFRSALGHSLLWELGAALVPSAVGLGFALLAQASRGRTMFLAAIFFPALLPATVVAALWTLVLSPLSGLLNTLLRTVGLGTLASDWLGDPHLALGALFTAWLWASLGIGTLIFWAGLRTIGREYIELAMVEGAGRLWRFRHVILPGLQRAGGIVLLVNAALGAQVFDLVFVTTGGGPGYATMLLPIDMYGRAFGGHTGQGAAVACVQLLTTLALATGVLLLLRGGGSLDSSGPEGLTTRPGGWIPAGILAVLTVLLLLPLGWLLLAAVQPGRAFALYGNGPGLDPTTWQWSNFATVWNSGWSDAAITSLGLAALVVGGTLLVAAPAAFALAHLLQRSLWRFGALLLLLFGLLQPATVTIIPLFALLHEFRLLDTIWGVVLPEIARLAPFGVLVLWGFLAQAPPEVMEAARLDGASPLQLMLRVALPLARPAILAVTVWAFVSSWNEYLLPTVVSQDGSLQTVPTLLGGFIGRYDTEYGLLAASALLSMLPSLVLYLALRYPATRGLNSRGRVGR